MKKNKKFVMRTFIIAIIVFGAFTYFSKQEEETQVPPLPAWVFEILVRSDSFIKGNPQAKVTVVEFFDPECEACRAVHPVVKKLLDEYPNQVRFVYRYMPFHSNSLYAASILEEAKAQGKYEAALEILFEKQPEWGDHYKPRPDLMPGYLINLGMNPESLKKEIIIPKHQATISRDKNDGERLLVNKTPTFFVNGRMAFEIDYRGLKAAIERALKENQEK